MINYNSKSHQVR